MAPEKHAMLVFSKPPVPGLVKTRLVATSRFSEEQVAEFYRRSLYDVADLSMRALMELQAQNDAAVAAGEAEPAEYHFFVSTTPAESVPKMRETFEEIGPWPLEVHYITDEGENFDDHFDDAFGKIFSQGYTDIVSVGGDMPTMPQTHITQAFQWLAYFRSLGTPGFVQAPCQECGTSLVGLSADTPLDHQEIYYNLEGRAALDGYVEKLQALQNTPSAYLSPVSDIDEMTDFAHAVSCIRAIAEAGKYQPGLFVPQRTLDWIDFMGIRVTTPPNENHDPRQYIDK